MQSYADSGMAAKVIVTPCGPLSGASGTPRIGGQGRRTTLGARRTARSRVRAGMERAAHSRVARAGLALAACLALALGGCQATTAVTSSRTSARTPVARATGIHAIRHVVVVMQENRSFDSYFGTFPGADGIPSTRRPFTVCVPDPRRGACDAPYHDPRHVNGGGPHDATPARRDIDGGTMDGFVRTAE